MHFEFILLFFLLKGSVYNVTHYMEYHPGGEAELMKGAGKDATDLFDLVNIDLFYFVNLKLS